MILSMTGQAWLFLSAGLAGAAAGLIYDLFRILRKTAPHTGFIVQLEDLIFWIGVTLFMFYFMLMESNGEIRWFSLLGAALGGLLYFAALSRWVVLVSVTIIEIIKKITGTVINIMLWPFRKIFLLLKRPVKKAAGFIRKNLRGALAYGKMKLRKTAGQIRIILKKV